MRITRSVSAIVVVVIAMTASEGAQQSPPSNRTTNNVTAPTQQNTVTSNPVGENTNIQQNYNYNGVQAFGPGIQCNVPYISSSMYQNSASSTSPSLRGGSSNAASGNIGYSVGLVVPVGGAIDRNCKDLSSEILTQRQLDTCIAVISRGLYFNPKKYPDLARRCNDAFTPGPGFGNPRAVEPITPSNPSVVIPSNPGQSNNGIVVPAPTPLPTPSKL